MIASRCSFCMKVTLAMPSSVRSFSAGTFIGPGEGAVPGAGCGKAVERAVWKVDVALDLLHHLMDVAVEHRHRAEALEQASACALSSRAPAPFG